VTGGAAWDPAGNPAAAAAIKEAASGAWLNELESGRPELLKAVAPGMGHGMFGGWAAEAAAAGEAVAASDAAADALVGHQQAGQQAAEAAAAAAAQHLQQQQKVSLDSLFR
jgi:antiviral helicase SKI2